MSFNHGTDPTFGAAGHWGVPDVGWAGNISTSRWTLVAYTFDRPTMTVSVYRDGQLANSEVVTVLDTHEINNTAATNGLPFRVASQNEANGTSTAGLRGYKTMSAYSASKHGVIGLTRSLALETAKQGITVNAVCPSFADTDMTAMAVENLVRNLGKTPEQAMEMLVRTIPRGRLITPSEVASAVSWLCSPSASGVTGIALPVAGGEI